MDEQRIPTWHYVVKPIISIGLGFLTAAVFSSCTNYQNQSNNTQNYVVQGSDSLFSIDSLSSTYSRKEDPCLTDRLRSYSE